MYSLGETALERQAREEQAAEEARIFAEAGIFPDSFPAAAKPQQLREIVVKGKSWLPAVILGAVLLGLAKSVRR